MRVLIVHPGVPIYGGAEMVIVQLVRYLKRMGIGHSYLTTGLPAGMREALGDTSILISRNRTGTRLNEMAALWRGVHACLGQYDVLNAHNFPAHLALFPARQPAVWMCNEPPEMFSSLVRKPVEALGRFVARNYIRYTVVSDESNARAFEAIYHFRPEIIHYGVDYEFFAAGGGRRDREKFTILQVGTLTPYKNQMASLRAVAELADSIPNIRLVLAGWGQPDYVASLKRYIAERGMEARVVLAGSLNREQVREWYQASDMLLHPIGPQGGWLTPFEALCAGVPVVVSREFNAAYLVQRENLGVVTDDYRQAIWDIYQDRAKYAGVAARGKAWVREHLGWDEYCRRMVALFSRAMEAQHD
ncbi:MAG: glycosyltransferase family 4 protein [Chloroflexota bacterium]